MKTTKDERDGLRDMAGMVTESLLMPPGAILDLLDDADELERLREALQGLRSEISTRYPDYGCAWFAKAALEALLEPTP